MLSQLLCSVSALILSVRYIHASDIYETDLFDPFEISSAFDFNEYIQHTTENDMDQFNDDHDPFDHSTNIQILPNENSLVITPMTETSRGIKRDFQSMEQISESADTANDALNHGTGLNFESIAPMQFSPNQQQKSITSVPQWNAQDYSETSAISIPAPQYNTPVHNCNEITQEPNLLTDNSKDKTQTSRSYSKRVTEPLELSKQMREVLAHPDKSKSEQLRKYTRLLYHMIKNDLSFNPTVLHMDGKQFCNEMGGETVEQLARAADHSLSEDDIVYLIGDVGSDERRRFFGEYINPDDPNIERDERRVRSNKLKQMIENNKIRRIRVKCYSGQTLKMDMQDFFNQKTIPRGGYKSRLMRSTLYRMVEKGLLFDDVISQSDPPSLIHALGGTVSSIAETRLLIPIDSIDEYIGSIDLDERKRFFGEIPTEYDRIMAIEEAKRRQSKLIGKSSMFDSDRDEVSLFPSGKQDIDRLFPSLIMDEQWPRMPAIKMDENLEKLKRDIFECLFYSSQSSLNDQNNVGCVQTKQYINPKNKPEKYGTSVHQSAINSHPPTRSKYLRDFRTKWESHFRELILCPGSVKAWLKKRIINTLSKFVEIGGFAYCDLNLKLTQFQRQMNWPSMDSISKQIPKHNLEQLKTIIGDVGSDEWKYWFGYDNMTN